MIVTVLLLISLVLFLVDAAGFTSRVGLQSLGLAFLVAAFLVPRL